MKEIVKAVDLWKVYKLGKVEYAALRGVNLSIGRGEMVAIVGPSGSGKSTLLNLMGALDRPTRGHIYLDGVELSSLGGSELAEIRNKKIGFVFQTFNLVPYMNALENVELPMVASGLPARRRREEATRLLEAVGLADRLFNKPSELSGGEQQRVAIARALANSPSIVLADEPTGNLDSKSTRDVVNLLKKINEEKEVTIIIVTHNLEVASACDRIVYLRDGAVEKEVAA